jgi:hypothetical protein
MNAQSLQLTFGSREVLDGQAVGASVSGYSLLTARTRGAASDRDYWIESLRVNWPAGMANNLRGRFYYATQERDDGAAPVDIYPLLSSLGNVDYLVGDGTPHDIPLRRRLGDVSSYLRATGEQVDTDVAAQAAHADVFITEGPAMRAEILPVVFYQAALAVSTRATLVSSRIPFAYRVVEIAPYWEPGTGNLLRLNLYAGQNDEAPTDAEPDDRALLGGLGPVNYLAGQGYYQRMPMSVTVPEVDTYLKLHARNVDPENTHNVSAVVLIEKLDPSEVI